MSLTEQLKKWAEETTNLYHNLATTERDCDLAFYTQSDLTKITQSPELVILGINPGSSGSYSESEYVKKNGKMTPERLLKGNYEYFSEREKTWEFWKRLKTILSCGKIDHLLEDEAKFVYTNMIFFNTAKAYQIPKIALEKCPEKTIELLKTLNPKRIICLGKNDCFKRLNIPYKDLIHGQITFGKLGEIPVYGIQHPSRNYSYEKRELVGKCLGYLFENQGKEISSEELETKFQAEIKALAERKPNLSKVKAEKIAKEVQERFKHLYYENNRFSLTDKLFATAIHSENGYVAIRHKNFEGGKKYHNGIYPNESQLIDFLIEEYNYSQSDVWLGKKFFREYGNSEEEIIENIITELNELQQELQKIK